MWYYFFMHTQRPVIVAILVLSFMANFALRTGHVNALAAQSSASVVTGGLQATVDNTDYQNYAASPQQTVDGDTLQASQIEWSLLTQYSNDTDLIVGTYSYGSLQNLRLTRQQAEIIKNGYVPILGNRGDAPIANPEKDYVEYDCGSSCSGDRAIMQCSTTPMAYDGYKTEYEVIVKGSKYGTSSGGYVCVGPNSIRNQCSGIHEQNPCINGTYQLDNGWLVSIGVDTAEIRRQIEAKKVVGPTLPPPQPSETPELTQPEPQI